MENVITRYFCSDSVGAGRGAVKSPEQMAPFSGSLRWVPAWSGVWLPEPQSPANTWETSEGGKLAIGCSVLFFWFGDFKTR